MKSHFKIQEMQESSIFMAIPNIQFILISNSNSSNVAKTEFSLPKFRTIAEV